LLYYRQTQTAYGCTDVPIIRKTLSKKLLL